MNSHKQWALRRIDMTSLFSTPKEEPPSIEDKYVVHPLIPRGRITILQGDAGTGKTHLAMALIQAAYSGSTWLGYPVEPQELTVFFDIQSGARLVGYYLRSYKCEREERYGHSVHHFDVEPGQFNATFFEEAMRQAGAVPGKHALAIIDNLSDFAVTGDVNDAHHVSKILKPIDEACRDHNWTLVCLDYPPKHYGAIAGGEDDQRRGTPYGAAVKLWVARSAMQMVFHNKTIERDRTLVRCTLRHVKSNAEAAPNIPFTLVFQKEGWWHIELGTTEEHGAAGKVLAIVRENPGLTAEEISKMLDKTSSYVRKLLTQLERQGLIKKLEQTISTRGGRPAHLWLPCTRQ
ncbi:MAG: hypothetical protein KatS3mg038_2901 [Candidatus Kapaibacterium sp.]|nr:MAG: hypothetical protein KatS3mg038_2765 [Candidatus Kapabacteria bacterium]GIV52380.1 MAG: hypothetical protein KatS3mg038_2901 [Candidatus Kapabacteria bacterium]